MRLPFGLDPGRAAFSLVLAVLLYVFALNETNPETTRTTDFTVPVEVVNVPAGLLLADRPPAVQLRVRAPQDVFSRLRPESFGAQVDAGGTQAGTQELDVAIRSTSPEVRDATALPSRVRLRLDAVQERSLPVRVSTVGQVPSGYQVGTARADPARITVSGAESVTRTAVEAVVEVNLDRVTVTVNGVFTPRVVDGRGNEVREVTVRPSAVNVEIPITQQAQFKEVGVRPRIVGSPAPGYLLEPVEVEPPTTTLFGEPAALEGANFVETVPADVTGLTGTVVRRLALVAPPNTLLLQQGQTVDVTIRVSPLTISQTLRVIPTIVNLPPSVVLARPPDPVSITLVGPAPTLANLTARDLRVVLDATGKTTAGRVEIDARVQNMPPGMTLENMDPIRVPIDLREVATPSPLASATPAP
ncbi:MAG: hypothetical protein HYX52_06900 [Chloroflexi bacterium]|nr:hypothetical protein [Chloroflexota bacterium]